MPKIGLSCRSELLRETLRLMLAEELVALKDADLILSDRRIRAKKPLLVVGEDLKIPFTRQMLQEAIASALRTPSESIPKDQDVQEPQPTLQEHQPTKEELERIIAELNKKHRQMISRLIKAYHGQ